MKQKVTLQVNKDQKAVYVRAADTLLDTLRMELGLTGAKPACENGDCGACTVLVNDRPMKSCLVLTVEMKEELVTTIEGLQDTPIQQAFLKRFAFQCGYCTAGFIMNCHALVRHHPNAKEYERMNWLQSNICRCTGYEEIKEAILDVLKSSKNDKASSF